MSRFILKKHSENTDACSIVSKTNKIRKNGCLTRNLFNIGTEKLRYLCSRHLINKRYDKDTSNRYSDVSDLYERHGIRDNNGKEHKINGYGYIGINAGMGQDIPTE